MIELVREREHGFAFQADVEHGDVDVSGIELR